MQRREPRGPPGNQKQEKETGVTSGTCCRMSGILKRKLEEEPSSCLSSHGSEDDEVSCSDSGNSSDSVNNSVPSGILDSSVHRQSKRSRGRNVHFESVTVYYFTRRQGFTSVPTQGGSTLGMSPRHSGVKRFTLREFAMEQKRSHRNMLRDHLKEEKLNAIKLKLTKNGTVSSMEADTLTLDDISEDDLDVDNTEVDDYFFLQPSTTRRRRALLRASGVRRIDVEEKHESRTSRMSREECGCRCRGICDPETCACSSAGIKCQVDRMSFPCGCTKDGCSNNAGRLEFNPVRVRTHFSHTIMKSESEKSHEEQYPHQQTEQPLVTSGNGYHGDTTLIQQQQQQNPQSSKMSNPIMHLQNAGDTESNLDEDEEEDEDEDDDDEEEDEAYDEDGSSVCSGSSDCSTHSLETLDPEDGEEDEDEEEDEEDEEEDDEEDEEEDWDCSLHGSSPPSYSVPLPSVMSYTNSARLGLTSPFHNTPPMQHYQIDGSANNPPAFLSENSNVAPMLPSVESASESEMSPELHRQAEQQSHFLHAGGSKYNAAPTGAPNQHPHSAGLQKNPDCGESQAVGNGESADEQAGRQMHGDVSQTASSENADE